MTFWAGLLFGYAFVSAVGDSGVAVFGKEEAPTKLGRLTSALIHSAMATYILGWWH